MKEWNLKITKQCKNCPWRKDSDPYLIPGYDRDMHANLKSTISDHLFDQTKTMSCHKTKTDDRAMCVGWLVNQLGPGNNIPLRFSMQNCSNSNEIEVYGEQHEHFRDTIPDKKGDTKKHR